jgi:hypothetical protein
VVFKLPISDLLLPPVIHPARLIYINKRWSKL